MKKTFLQKQFHPLLFLAFFMAACNGQTKPTPPLAPPDNLPATKTNTNQGLTLDKDPYFVETTANESTFGPSSIVRNMVQDKNGHIWLATWEGIIRYDGKTFTNFTNKAGLRRYHVFSAMEDRAGNLWFGTIGAGVYRYDGATFTNFTTKEGLVDNNIGDILEDKAGNIWIGTFGGLSRYDGHVFTNFTHKEGMDVNSIVQDKNGKIWVGARENLYFFDGQSFVVFKNDKDLPFNNVRSVLEDKNGHLWFGGQDGLCRYDGKCFTAVTTNFIGFIYEDSKGTIWTCSSAQERSMTLSFFKKTLPAKDPTFVLLKKERGQVFGIMEDTAGYIWYGTETGVCRYDGAAFACFSEEAAKK